MKLKPLSQPQVEVVEARFKTNSTSCCELSVELLAAAA